jgi:hypothetical protein
MEKGKLGRVERIELGNFVCANNEYFSCTDNWFCAYLSRIGTLVYLIKLNRISISTIIVVKVATD